MSSFKPLDVTHLNLFVPLFFTLSVAFPFSINFCHYVENIWVFLLNGYLVDFQKTLVILESPPFYVNKQLSHLSQCDSHCLGEGERLSVISAELLLPFLVYMEILLWFCIRQYRLTKERVFSHFKR